MTSMTIKITPPKPVTRAVQVFLNETSNGVTLRVGAWEVLSITENGTIKRHGSIPVGNQENLQVESTGRILIE